MPSLFSRTLLLPVALLSVLANASPTPAPTPVVIDEAARVAPREPAITPALSRIELYRAYIERRGIISDLTAGVDSILSELGNVPSYVASGVDPFFQNYPTGTKVQSSLSLDNSQVSAIPTQVLNIDPYANWTNKGWNVRFHGNVYKQPNVSTSKLDDLANVFVPNVKVQNLPASEAAQARNLTAEIFVIQQGDVNVSTITLEPAGDVGSNDGGAMPATGGSQSLQLPYKTTPEGDFDTFVQIQSNGLTAGNETQQVQRLNTYVEGASLGNSTAYLVPEEGITIVSDIDDILRVTKIYEPEKGLLNTFVRPFTPWMNMPSIYHNLSESLNNIHFHYLTTTPEQITRNYMQFIYSDYPLGSFDTRPLNFSNVEETLHVRLVLLEKVIQTFPKRKFILVADTSNSDVMTDYPEMAHKYPDQVQCIWLRNTSATDSGDKFPYDTSGFKGLHQDKYMFFLVPDDLTNLDVANGQCYNQSIPQNVTYSYQGLPGGLSQTTSINGSANGTGESGATAMQVQYGMTFSAFLGALLWNLL